MPPIWRYFQLFGVKTLNLRYNNLFLEKIIVTLCHKI